MSEPITPPANASHAIREYGQKHGVFGAQEIRELFGQRAALLCSRLAAKKQFTRIRNGVYSMLNDATDQDAAYDRHLNRVGAAREEKGHGKAGSLIDQLIAHLKQCGGATEVQINQHFGRDMHGTIAPYFKRGLLSRTNSVYSYAGEKPAERRSARPSAQPTAEEQGKVETHLQNASRSTVKEMQEQTDIDSHRLTNILEVMTQSGRVIRHDPISTNSHATYSLPGKATKSVASKVDETTMACLAIAASEESVSARGLATHKLDHDRHQLSRMEEMGLVFRRGEDEYLGGARFTPTAAGIALLDKEGWKYRGVPAIAHRPLNRVITELAGRPAGTSIQEVRAKTEATRYVAQNAVQQLAEAGVVKTSGRPMKITLPS